MYIPSWGRVTCFLGNWFINSLQCLYSGESIQSNSSSIFLKGSGKSIQSNSIQVIKNWCSDPFHTFWAQEILREIFLTGMGESESWWQHLIPWFEKKWCLSVAINRQLNPSKAKNIRVIQFNQGNVMLFHGKWHIFRWLGLNRFPSHGLESWISGRESVGASIPDSTRPQLVADVTCECPLYSPQTPISHGNRRQV